MKTQEAFNTIKRVVDLSLQNGVGASVINYLIITLNGTQYGIRVESLI
jgi:hypothetical protein